MSCLMLVVGCLIHSPIDDDELSHAGCQLSDSQSNWWWWAVSCWLSAVWFTVQLMMMNCLMLVVGCLIHSPIDDDELSHAGCRLSDTQSSWWRWAVSCWLLAVQHSSSWWWWAVYVSCLIHSPVDDDELSMSAVWYTVQLMMMSCLCQLFDTVQLMLMSYVSCPIHSQVDDDELFGSGRWLSDTQSGWQW